MTARVVVLINGQAGGATSDDEREQLRAAITAAVGEAEVRFCDEHTDVPAAAREAVENGAAIVVAGGGDGTVSAVASAVAGTRATMGLLPLGTLNHFAKDLGIPTDRDAAIDVLANGGTTCVDVAEVNQRIFVNNSGLGLYPAIVRLRDQEQELRGLKKWPAFALATLKALSRYRQLHLRVKTGAAEFVRTTPIIFVGNNRYATEGPHLGTRERLDGGELGLVIPHPRGPLRLVWYSILALFGRRYAGPNVDVLNAPRFRIESHHPRLRVSVDGEIIELATPLEYRSRPRALRVLVPAREAAR